MPLKLTVSAHYPQSADAVFARAKSFADMIRASRPLTFYKGLPRTDMEEGRTYVTDIAVLGLIRVPGYHIEIKRLDSAGRMMLTREGNSQVRAWLHLLIVEPQAQGCRWTDYVLIDADAGIRRIAQFARLMYMKRHKSRKARLVGTEIRQI